LPASRRFAFRYRRLEPGRAPVEVFEPARQLVPLVFASPHSGRIYPEEFVRAARLDPLTLRRSEDAFMDEILAAAPEMGAPLIRANFPRAFIDPNREPYELDPAMFEDALPEYVNAASPRVAAGLGTVARVVTSGDEIYAKKLRFAEAQERIRACYEPYHRRLDELVKRTRQRFGLCVLIDGHSMPSVGGPMDSDPGSRRVDVVLGDAHGSACAPQVIDAAERAFKGLGFAVTRNNPYAGGFTTRHYGRPGENVHALQIEINRALYMDERRIERGPGLPALAERLAGVIDALSRIELVRLAAE
jgi:N-formylglutamate amidohydrolase